MSQRSNPLATIEPWSLIASQYTNDASWIVAPFALKAIKLADASKDMTPLTNVIDVASGPGTLSLRIAPSVASVSAVDFSDEMLAELRSNAQAFDISNIKTIHADGQALPIAAGQFDAGFSMFGLQFFPDRIQGLTELYRVLRPSGVAIVSSWAPAEQSTLMMMILGAMHAAEPAMNMPETDEDSMANPKVMAREMREAGFSDVSVYREEIALSPVTARELFERVERSGAQCVLLRRRLGEKRWSMLAQRAKHFLEAQFEGGAKNLSTVAYLGVGKKR